eukprot:XP_001705924.1 Hypothetical protein GL50803_19150 [Giardia lamblia ATCC 50803]
MDLKRYNGVFQFLQQISTEKEGPRNRCQRPCTRQAVLPLRHSLTLRRCRAPQSRLLVSWLLQVLRGFRDPMMIRHSCLTKTRPCKHTHPRQFLAFLSHRNLCTAPGRSSPIHNHRTLSQTLFIRFHHSFLASHISKYYIITPLRRSFPSLSTLNHSISSHPSLARISTNLLITRFILITSAIATLAICR